MSLAGHGAHRSAPRTPSTCGAGAGRHRRAGGACPQSSPLPAGRLAGRGAGVRTRAGRRLGSMLFMVNVATELARASSRIPLLRGGLHSAEAAHPPRAARRSCARRDPSTARVGGGREGAVELSRVPSLRCPSCSGRFHTLPRSAIFRAARLCTGRDSGRRRFCTAERAARRTIALHGASSWRCPLLFIPISSIGGLHYATVATGLGPVFLAFAFREGFAWVQGLTRTAGPSRVFVFSDRLPAGIARRAAPSARPPDRGELSSRNRLTPRPRSPKCRIAVAIPKEAPRGGRGGAPAHDRSRPQYGRSCLGPSCRFTGRCPALPSGRRARKLAPGLDVLHGRCHRRRLRCFTKCTSSCPRPRREWPSFKLAWKGNKSDARWYRYRSIRRTDTPPVLAECAFGPRPFSPGRWSFLTGSWTGQS